MASAVPSPTQETSPRRRLGTLGRSETLAAWIFSAPAIILLIVFLVIPFFMAIGLAFTDQRLIPNPNLPTRIVGLRNLSDWLKTKPSCEAC